jgi:poly-gamma-glutamate capsule biosynthesis protein CapA/YwtB (metallophosphatase superfamily)
MFRKRFCSLSVIILNILIFLLGGDAYFAQKVPNPASGNINWDQRVDKLLKASKGDIILTAVGDMIFNREISHFTEPHYQNLYRILKNARLAYGNLEMSLNEKPEFQIGFRDFRRGRDFAWEIAKIGIDTVSLANNHTLDYGAEGLKDCLRILRQSRVSYAGAGLNLTGARAARFRRIRRTRFALLSFYSSGYFLRTNPKEPTIATIGAPSVLIEKEDGSIEAIRAPLESDVTAMEDAISIAKRHADIVMVAFHFHWVSHSRAYPVPDKVPPNQTLVVHKAVNAGADIILGSGPHVLRGIEIYKGKPIFYSLGNFIYQYQTPPEVPDIIWQRGEQTDIREEFETVVARLTIREKKICNIELIPVTLDMEGPHYACPRLANDKRGKEIIELLQKFSQRFKTKINYKYWYGAVEM